MPEPDRVETSARPGHYGAAGTGVVFSEATIATAWNLQGEAEGGSFRDETRKAFGIDLPIEPNTVGRGDGLSALWLGPGSWLIISGERLGGFTEKREAMNAAGGALFDVTCARVAWNVSGPHAPAVLGKGCPLDFHPRAFAPGSCAQSLFGRVNALFAREENAIMLMVARSFARDAWRMLCESAAQYGYDVVAAAPYP